MTICHHKNVLDVEFLRVLLGFVLILLIVLDKCFKFHLFSCSQSWTIAQLIFAWQCATLVYIFFLFYRWFIYLYSHGKYSVNEKCLFIPSPCEQGKWWSFTWINNFNNLENSPLVTDSTEALNSPYNDPGSFFFEFLK